jgi:hypothetical protein
VWKGQKGVALCVAYVEGLYRRLCQHGRTLTRLQNMAFFRRLELFSNLKACHGQLMKD